MRDLCVTSRTPQKPNIFIMKVYTVFTAECYTRDFTQVRIYLTPDETGIVLGASPSAPVLTTTYWY